MRFLEAIKTICNKFTHKEPQTQPEVNQRVPEETEVTKNKDNVEAITIQPHKKEDGNERLIRKYRAYAYHHKKWRIRKKYRKKLAEISSIDRLVYVMSETGYTAEEVSNALRRTAELGLLENKYGWGKDHMDGRVRGGIR